MNTEWVIIFIAIVAGMVVISFLLKSFAKIVLLLGLIYLLFHLGFLWGADDLNEKLHLNQFLKPEASQQLDQKYSDFTKKRDDSGIIETEAVRKAIDTAIQDTLAKSSKQLQEVDKEQFLKDLNTKLQSFDTGTVIKVLDGLKEELAKYNVTEQDIQNLANQTK